MKRKNPLVFQRIYRRIFLEIKPAHGKSRNPLQVAERTPGMKAFFQNPQMSRQWRPLLSSFCSSTAKNIQPIMVDWVRDGESCLELGLPFVS
jgi:hypothetical protein